MSGRRTPNLRGQALCESALMRHSGIAWKWEAPGFFGGGGLLSYTRPHKKKIVF